MKETINTLKKQIESVRKNIESTLIMMMKDHDVEDINCGGYSCTPVIANDSDAFTLDSIQLCRTRSGDEYILCEASGEYDNINITAKSMDIEYLIAVYEWTLEYFENEYEEDSDEDDDEE